MSTHGSSRHCPFRGLSRSSYFFIQQLRGVPGSYGELTINETFFFRNADNFRAFTSSSFPSAFGSAVKRSVFASFRPDALPVRSRIPWLRLCATRCPISHLGGENHGIDVNPAMLAKPHWPLFGMVLRATPRTPGAATSRSRQGVRARPEIRKMVTFEERNLIDADPLFWRRKPSTSFSAERSHVLQSDHARAVVQRISQALLPVVFSF